MEVQVASEFRYNDPIVDAQTLAIIISQSGETADTLAALREAKIKGATTLALVNVVGSSIAREADEVLYTYAGPEICVASTKAYVTQLDRPIPAWGFTSRRKRTSWGRAWSPPMSSSSSACPNRWRRYSPTPAPSRPSRGNTRAPPRSSSLGRGNDYAVAQEGALKLKEVSYIHAEAYPAGELKHGPLALVEPGVSVVCIATQSALYDKIQSSVKEVKARDGAAIGIVKAGDEGLDENFVDSILRVPATHDTFMPVLSIIPMQLLAYYIAADLGREIDQPRNLAKSVTVE